MGRGLFALTLCVALAALWITLSGRVEEPLLLVLGVASILVVFLLVNRMNLLDSETSSFHRLGSLIAYWIWLGGQIVRANIAVAREALRVDLDLSPRLFRVSAGQKTDFGRTIYANSITLTPGTVTVDLDSGEFIVHALLESMSEPSGFEAMNRRVTRAAEGRAS